MTTLTFTDAVATDLEELIALTQATHEEHAAVLPNRFRPGAPAETAKWFQSFIDQPQGVHPVFSRVIVCRDAGAFVGHVLIVFWKTGLGPDAHDLRGSIFDISVIPSRRGQGIGRMLFDRAHDAMRHAGVTLALATVRRGNATSEALFTRAGYPVVSQEFELRRAPPLPGPLPVAAAKPAGWRGFIRARGEVAMVVALTLLIGFLAWSGR